MNDARPWTRNDGTPSRDLPPGWTGARWPGAPPGLCSARCSPSSPRAPRYSPPRRCATGPSGSTSHTLSLFTTTTIFLHNFRSLCHFHPFWWSPFALNSLGILPWVIAWKCNELLRRLQRAQLQGWGGCGGLGRCGVGWPPPQLESLPPVSTRLLLSQTTLGRSPPAAHTSPRLLPRGASASYTIHGPKTQGILLHQLQPRTDTLSSHHDIAMQQFFLRPKTRRVGGRGIAAKWVATTALVGKLLNIPTLLSSVSPSSKLSSYRIVVLIFCQRPEIKQTKCRHNIFLNEHGNQY